MTSTCSTLPTCVVHSRTCCFSCLVLPLSCLPLSDSAIVDAKCQMPCVVLPTLCSNSSSKPSLTDHCNKTALLLANLQGKGSVPKILAPVCSILNSRHSKQELLLSTYRNYSITTTAKAHSSIDTQALRKGLPGRLIFRT